MCQQQHNSTVVVGVLLKWNTKYTTAAGLGCWRNMVKKYIPNHLAQYSLLLCLLVLSIVFLVFWLFVVICMSLACYMHEWKWNEICHILRHHQISCAPRDIPLSHGHSLGCLAVVYNTEKHPTLGAFPISCISVTNEATGHCKSFIMMLHQLPCLICVVQKSWIAWIKFWSSNMSQFAVFQLTLCGFVT